MSGGGEMTETKCIVCGTDVPDYHPEYCCDGIDCACRGLPIDPCVCSDKCWDFIIRIT